MGRIGENPHPLVSARFPLHMFSSRNFAQDYHIPPCEMKASLNSPDVSIPITRESCNSCMKLTMTVRADQNAFIEFCFHSFPPSRIPLGRNAKVFSFTIEMMKFERLCAS